MKKYLLFDLDGTLTDPKLGITSCVQYALRSFGIEESDLDKLEPFIGPPLKDSFMQFYGMDEAKAEQAVIKYRERFGEIGIFENEVYKGIVSMLRLLQAKGVHLAVASSKPTVYVERILKHFHMVHYFEVIVGSELDGSRVNKAEVVQEALKRLFGDKPIQHTQVYMIGDRKFDMEGARAHHIESVGVAYGYGSIEELKEAKADYIVRSVEELRKFLLRDTDEDEAQGNLTKRNFTQKIWDILLTFFMFLIVRSAAMYLLFLLGTNLTSILGDVWVLSDETGQFQGYTSNAVTIMGALSYAVAALAIWEKASVYIKKTKDIVRLSHLKGESMQSYLMMFLASVGAVIGFNLLFGLTKIVEQSASYQEVATEQYAASLLVGLVCYGLISPIAEELLFRGTIYNCLRQFGNVKLAILFSAMIFGLYHGNIVQGVYGCIMGCLIAYAYEYFGSFKAPVFVHIIANVTAYALSYASITIAELVSWIVCMVCLVMMAFCIVRLHKRRNVF